MQLREVMTRDVEVVEPSATLKEVAERMRALNVGAIPICNGERVEGLVTDRDLVVRGLAIGLEGSSSISEVMSPEIEWLFEDEDVQDAAELMKERQIRRLLVMNRDKKLVGIVSLGDLALEEKSEGLSKQVLQKVSEPVPSIH